MLPAIKRSKINHKGKLKAWSFYTLISVDFFFLSSEHIITKISFSRVNHYFFIENEMNVFNILGAEV